MCNTRAGVRLYSRISCTHEELPPSFHSEKSYYYSEMRLFTGESVSLVAYRVENTPIIISGGLLNAAVVLALAGNTGGQHGHNTQHSHRLQAAPFSCTFHLFPSPLFCSPPRDLTLRRLTHLVTTETGPRWPAGARRVRSGGFIIARLFDKARPLSLNVLTLWSAGPGRGGLRGAIDHLTRDAPSASRCRPLQKQSSCFFIRSGARGTAKNGPIGSVGMLKTKSENGSHSDLIKKSRGTQPIPDQRENSSHRLSCAEVWRTG